MAFASLLNIRCVVVRLSGHPSSRLSCDRLAHPGSNASSRLRHLRNDSSAAIRYKTAVIIDNSFRTPATLPGEHAHLFRASAQQIRCQNCWREASPIAFPAFSAVFIWHQRSLHIIIVYNRWIHNIFLRHRGAAVKSIYMFSMRESL